MLLQKNEGPTRESPQSRPSRRVNSLRTKLSIVWLSTTLIEKSWEFGLRKGCVAAEWVFCLKLKLKLKLF